MTPPKRANGSTEAVSAPHNPFAPKSLALALEPRILFDGAAATAVDHQQGQMPDNAEPSAHENAFPVLPDTAMSPRPSHLVVLDSRVENQEQLLCGLSVDTQAIIVDSSEEGLAAISAALQTLGKVDSIQIFSHGAAGQFTLGDRAYTSETLAQYQDALNEWRHVLTPGADIQLYGCNVGAGSAGQLLVEKMAQWTGADVGASSDDSGNPLAGGNWVLETRFGVIDKGIAITADALASFDGLLANASPSAVMADAGSNVNLGDTFNFTLNFNNISTQIGYAPYVDLFLPSTGKDGNDGVSFLSASYLGRSINAYVMNFDASGKATHPLARDSNGDPLIIDAAEVGMRPGDQFVVLELPFASVSQDLPTLVIDVTAQLSNLADTDYSNPAADLVIRSRGGFQYGNDSLNNPQVDPSLVEAALHEYVVHPTLLNIQQQVLMPEGETATGPNFSHTQTVTVTPPSGQTLRNVTVTQTVPDTVQVTGISTGSGVLTSVILHDGRVLTDPAQINAALADPNVFVSQYSVYYATLSAASDTQVSFYVPHIDALGRPVLDPDSGAAVDITWGTPIANGEWTPLDPRDLPADQSEIRFTATGDGRNADFAAKSMTLQKQVAIETDLGTVGLTPGDTLRYTLNIALSDYFSFGINLLQQGQFIVRDHLSDGQSLSGTATLSITENGVTASIDLIMSSTVNADGTTDIVFDVGQSILQVPDNRFLGALLGDLAFDDVLSSATTAVISYNTVVNQAYVSSYNHRQINEGDSISNASTVTATVMKDPVNMGSDWSDGSETISTIHTNNVVIELIDVNGNPVSANAELKPGDVVTFEMTYDLMVSDYEDFKLIAYLPLPLLDVSNIAWVQGLGIGQWVLGPDNDAVNTIDSVTTGPGNSVVFDFGNNDLEMIGGSRVQVRFTLQVGDQPYADQRSLDVLAQSNQLTTIDRNLLISSDVVPIVSIAEPVLDIRHGVVSSSNGVITGSSGSWTAPGSSGIPFQGSVTDLEAVNGDIRNIDGGDVLRLATAIKNSGGGGAFDVQTSVTLPPDLSFVGGSLATANLQIYRGDGTQLVENVDYTVTGNQIQFLDANDIASLLAGRAGTAADASGANVVIITYDVTVNNVIEAGRTLETTATLNRYASVNGGEDFIPGTLSETAGQQIAAPEVRKTFAGGTLDDGDSSAAHTSGNNLVIGESMLYDIIVTLPEGSTRDLRIQDFIPQGMRLDTGFNSGAGYQLITLVAESAALSADFNGTVTPGAMTGVSGTLGNDGVDAQWVFSAAGAAADNVVGNNSFIIRVRLVASNVNSNQANQSLQNSAHLSYSDPDGDTANGSIAVNREVALTGGQPTVIIREPTLRITQHCDTGPGFGVDENDTVIFHIEISNGSGSTDYDAFDISLIDVLPSQLDNVTLVAVNYANGATNNGLPDFELVNGQLRSVSGANIDVPKGGRIVLLLTGVVNASAASQPNFDNVATVQWTSLNGDIPGERTGVDGALNSGVLNDYRSSFTLRIPVLQQTQISRVGGMPDTEAVDPTYASHESVTIGELIRYRVVTVIAEGTTNEYNVQVTLPNGLEFINDGTLRIAFVSDNGIVSDQSLITGGTLDLVGSAERGEVLPIDPDLAGAAPTGVLDPALIDISTDANGNTVLTFNLGTLVNSDNDDDREMMSLEFNVRVANQASNVAGAQLGVVALDRSGSTQLSSSSTIYQDIVEPSFSGLDKRIVDFDPNLSGTSGNATVSVGFTQNGTLAAYDVHLEDSFPNGSGYTLVEVEVNGVAYTLANLPAGVSVSVDANGIAVDFDKLDVGDTVRLIYRVDVPNDTVVADSNAVLTWTSLPESFTEWGGSSIGADGTAEGERIGTGNLPNNYILQEGAGLGVISGTLWDDTLSATSSATPDGPGLANQTVTLTWAGLDGDLATEADNKVFTTITDANGQYRFGVLPSGVYRIDTPTGTISYPQPVGDLRVRIDTDPNSPLGQIIVNLGEGIETQANAGYVQQNDPPENHVPGTQTGLEDIPLPIEGITISDIDAGTGALHIRLSVEHGRLWLSSVPAGVTIEGANTAVLQLTGTIDQLNLALANLVYQGNLNYNGNDTLTMVTNDRGNFGDGNDDGIPGQNPEDAKSTTSTLLIQLTPVNDPPVAVDDSNQAVEAGGAFNSTVGVNPSGNLLNNDTDVDIATNDDRLSVISINAESQPSVSVPATGNVQITGRYGTLIVNAAGGYQYVVDNDHPEVQALRTFQQTLQERFEYAISDLAGETDSAILTITIHGANDAPVGNDDTGTAVEAGGVLNGTPGSDAVGNVLENDTDVDSVANGERLQVTGARTQQESQYAPFTNVPAQTTASNGATLVGMYGVLTLGSDGSYRYVLNNDHPDVQALGPNDTLNDYFTYQVTDVGGLSDVAQLTIIIQGAADNPVASDDVATAQAGMVDSNGNVTGEVNPIGNVILYPSRPGSITQPGGNGVDTDVDGADQPNAILTVNGIRQGDEGISDFFTPVPAGTNLNDGVILNGFYGELHIGADGSFQYVVDSTNPIVSGLAAGQTLTDVFTYQIVDSFGLTDQAVLTITIIGANDPPLALPTYAYAMEAGGVNNDTPGFDASGQVFDLDVDDDPLTIVGIRTGTQGGIGVQGEVGQPLIGQYGTLTINQDGTYQYVVNNSHPDVEALRQISDQLIDYFTYTLSDDQGATSQAEIIVTILGQNDAPVANDDTATAREAGGVDNNRPGVDPIGNVLTNDTDVDGHGETKNVFSVSHNGNEQPLSTGNTTIRGDYGWLTIYDDGTYSYRVDNDLAAVQALRSPSDTLSDVFQYNMLDALYATSEATLTIVIEGANDAPVANDDQAEAIEAGGVNNEMPGSNPSGNVLDNDTDVDDGDQMIVVGIRQNGNIGQVGTFFQGQYGQLLLNADGSYQYIVDNDNAQVQALRTSDDALNEVFTYVIQDLAGETSQALLSILIRGQNDAPVAQDDAAIAREAGGTFNDVPGVDPVGNLLLNDTDVDAGDSKTVDGIRTGGESEGGSFTAVPNDQSQVIQGQYGRLTVYSNGDYLYTVDNDLPAVQALREGETLIEFFTYRMRDTAGAEDTAQLQITVQGAWDAPVANDDIAYAQAEDLNGIGVDPIGNVLDNDTDVDRDDPATVIGIRLGEETAGGTLASVNAGTNHTNGTIVQGQYGQLIIGSDGSYQYLVNFDDPAVREMGPQDTLTEVFTYQIEDGGGLIDEAQLTVIIQGENDRPVANNDYATAIEAGGLNNGTAGLDPVGNVLDNDADIENDPLKVDAIRTGGNNETGIAGMLGVALRGRYGDLTLNADGSWQYILDNTLPEVEALRVSGQTLNDVFTYTMSDQWGAQNSAELVITIDGRNDAPIAQDDTAIAVEAGGVNNNIPGVDPTGNVLDNDTDVDGVDYGETKTVVSFSHEDGGTANAGDILVGRYGQLQLNADGTYQYVLDNANPSVQALNTGETLNETFSYMMQDTAGETSTADLLIIIQGRNDAPVAQDDTATAIEAGGLNNSTPGVDPSGNVLDNDTDVDSSTLTVTDIRSGATNGTVGAALRGQYGDLTLNADGSWTYVLDNTLPEVEALRTSGQTLTEIFTYTLSDDSGASDIANLIITIEGRNDTPIAQDDVAIAVEAGGTNNSTPGIDPTGNVLTNDTDVDAVENGETKQVVSFSNEDGGSVSAGEELIGRYGQLQLNADGSYQYILDNDNPLVEALNVGDTLNESFIYVMRDTDGATSEAVLRIVIHGVDDAPVAQDDYATAIEAGGLNNSTPGVDPSGNVLLNDTDQDSSVLTVTGVRTATTVGNVGTVLRGQYGDLTLNADGSWTYVLDNTLPEVEALRTSDQTLSDVFIYTMVDPVGLSNSANLIITIEGSNDTPIAQDDVAIAVEAGGTNNNISGTDPTGNVLTNDTDVDAVENGETKQVVSFDNEDGGSAAAGEYLTGRYGRLQLNADGSYQYILDNDNPAVEALNVGETLNETFTYTMRDTAGATSQANLLIIIHGADDAPVAQDDYAIAIEAGGLNNSTSGTDPSGNVLLNDTDQDSSVLTVTGVRTATTLGSVGTVLRGQYGDLTLNADGSWTYVLDNTLPEVEALRTSDQTLSEVFIYTMVDPAGLSSSANLIITIEGRNDTPIAQDDVAIAVEAGGTNNSIPGIDPTGNVLTNDTDVDAVENGETKQVVSFSNEDGGSANAGEVLIGRYGQLQLNADGSYQYILDNDNPLVEALNTGDTLNETFTYTMRDTAGATSQANLLITIQGTDDAPVAQDDYATAIEAGGLHNAIPGFDPSGNVLDNDSDDDSAVLTVTDIRTATASGVVGGALRGQYGDLTLNADGSWSYVLDNTLPEVEALRTSDQTLSDVFIYTMVDPAGLSSSANLIITIEGRNDTPIAQDDVAIAVEAGGTNNSIPGIDPTGNVLTNDTDVDAVENGETKQVVSFSNEDGGSANAGEVLIGRYGQLQLNADGSYQYILDNDNPLVEALNTGDTLNETFTYIMRDTVGATSQANLLITIQGTDDAPVAQDDYATAIEAGGLHNAIPGFDPSGNVLDNDSDDDSAVLTVTDIRTATATGVVGGALRGQYGDLTLNADGSWTYVLDNTLPEVEALRTSDQTLSDVFIYTMVDSAGLSSNANLIITIEGRNDTPIAQDDVAIAIEAGGTNNSIPGIDPIGNVLTNDTDVDAVENGETKQVVSFSNEGGGSANAGEVLIGRYGQLQLNADGSYQYILDNDNPAVEALNVGETLNETFTYTMRDTAGATSQANLLITIQGTDDAPVAQDDHATAIEAGGLHNAIPGFDPSDNVLDNDSDDDSAVLTVTDIRTATASGVVGGALRGQYGDLTLNADGSWSYVLDNTLPEVEALRTSDQTLSDVFIYTMVDSAGLSSTANLIITIEGRNDTPIAQDDVAIAVEAGGTNNSIPGIDPTGNVLTNDTDVDAVENGETKQVVSFSNEDGGSANAGEVLIGRYGQLQLNADGSYQYILDNDNPLVEALNTGDTLNETFTYIMRDTAGATSQANLLITIQGTDDAPVAQDDYATAIEAGGLHNAIPGFDPSGNVLDNDSDDDSAVLTVTNIRTATATGVVGDALRGQYGDLTLNADGSWSYVLDNTLPEVEALRTSDQTLSDVFIYTMVDSAGLSSSANLIITIEGRNDTPIAQDDVAIAVEAGGTNNSIPGIDPTGNVLTNDTDVDAVENGETKQVVGFRNEMGQSASAGELLAGRYGHLRLNADGSYHYELNNDDLTVQALRHAGKTLQEVFVYRMRDASGDTSEARLQIIIQGSNHAPQAYDDENVVRNDGMAPEAAGNVLINDYDPDGRDQLQVIGIETADGRHGNVGDSLAGRYGVLIVGADGHYRYILDMRNPEVMRAQSGTRLQDVFVYTITDPAGATSQAQLTIHLELTPKTFYYIPPPESERPVIAPMPLLDFDPAIFITPMVEQYQHAQRLSAWGVNGDQLQWLLRNDIQSLSLNARLHELDGQFVAESVRQSRQASEEDLARLLGRHGRVSLSADGLLSDPSVFAPFADDMTPDEFPRHITHTQSAAPAFTQQLQEMAARLHSIAQIDTIKPSRID